MKVLITGACGYMGLHVVKEALDAGHEVYAVDIRLNGLDERAHIPDIQIFSGDPDIYEKAGRPDVCIHLAWQDGFVHNSAKHMENLSSHFTFLKNMIDGGCKRIAVMGTMHEVGFWEGAIDENTPCNPMSQYGIAKNALRQAILQYAANKDANIYWLRAYYILGDDRRNNSIFAKMLQAADEGKTEFPFTSGTNMYDFITVDQLAKQIVAASTQDEITGIINVCTGKPITLRQQVESFIQEKGLNLTLKIGAYPDRPYDSKIVYGDAEKINKILENQRK